MTLEFIGENFGWLWTAFNLGALCVLGVIEMIETREQELIEADEQ